VVGGLQNIVDEDESLLGCDARLIGNLLLIFEGTCCLPFKTVHSLY